MRIAVLGAGRQGLACAVDLLREPEVREVRLLDADPQRLEAVCGRLSDDRVRGVRADVGHGAALDEALEGTAALISAVPYFLNLGVTEAAIRAGCSMTDMGGNTAVVDAQRGFDVRAKEAGVTIVPDMGLAPGLGNVLAVRSIEGFEEIEEVRIRCGGLPLVRTPPLDYALFFSVHGLLNEYSGCATCLRGGRRVNYRALSGSETIQFPEPLGRCEAVHTSGGISTLPWTWAGKVHRLDYKTVRYPGHWDRIRFLRDIGLLSKRLTRVGDASIVPRDLTASLLEQHLDGEETRDVVVLRVLSRGRVGRVRISRSYDLFETGEEDGLSAMAKTTAFPTVAVALQLGRRQIAPGVRSVEEAVDPRAVIAHLEGRGIEISATETIRLDSIPTS